MDQKNFAQKTYELGKRKKKDWIYKTSIIDLIDSTGKSEEEMIAKKINKSTNQQIWTAA